MNRFSKSNLTILNIAGCLVTCISILCISLLLVPESTRSNQFWYRVLWAEVLAVICWMSSAYYLISQSYQKDALRTGGSAPAVAVCVFTYSGLSLASMLAHAYFPNGRFSDHFHLAVQCTLLALATVLVIFLNIAREHSILTEKVSSEKPSPKELVEKLMEAEKFLTSSHEDDTKNLTDSVKRLREIIQYSLCDIHSLNRISKYETFSHQVYQLSDSILENRGGGVIPKRSSSVIRLTVCIL